MPQVLTRRDQLGLKAQEKEDKQNQKGSGRGGGRGRGRGRGAKPKTKPSEPEPENVPGEDVQDGSAVGSKASSSKRAVMCTPERRKLFHDTDNEISPLKGAPEAGPAADEKESPPVKAKKAKRRRKQQKTPKADKTSAPQPEEAMPVDEPAPELPQPEPANLGEVAMPAEVESAQPKPVKPPTSHQVSFAKSTLEDALSDPPTLAHVEKLFAATTVAEREMSLDKQIYWGYSLYYNTRRVGLLQLKGSAKRKSHVMSFGGGCCKHIGIPLEASRLMVGGSFVLFSHKHATCR